MSNENEKNYYIKKKKLLIRQYNAALNFVKKRLIEYFGESKVIEFINQARNDFEMLLPQVPYVGGKESRLTESLINSAMILPLLKIFEKQGLDFYEIGNLTYELFEIFYKYIPQAEDIFSEEYLEQEKVNAKRSKLRKYAGDWVYDFVEGDGKTFTFGIDYSECGVYKFYKSQGAEHFMPLICLSDYAQAQSYGYGLKRTQTIGNGASLCDFRYVKGGKTSRAWPPDNLPEFKAKFI